MFQLSKCFLISWLLVSYSHSTAATMIFYQPSEYSVITEQGSESMLYPSMTETNVEHGNYMPEPIDDVNNDEDQNAVYASLANEEHGSKTNQLSYLCSNQFSPFCNYQQSKYPHYQYSNLGYDSQTIYQRPTFYKQTTSMLPPQYNSAYSGNILYNGHIFDRFYLSQLPQYIIQSLISQGHLPPNYYHQTQYNNYQQALLKQQTLQHEEKGSTTPNIQGSQHLAEIPTCSAQVKPTK